MNYNNRDNVYVTYSSSTDDDDVDDDYIEPSAGLVSNGEEEEAAVPIGSEYQANLPAYEGPYVGFAGLRTGVSTNTRRQPTRRLIWDDESDELFYQALLKAGGPDFHQIAKRLNEQGLTMVNAKDCAEYFYGEFRFDVPDESRRLQFEVFMDRHKDNLQLAGQDYHDWAMSTIRARRYQEWAKKRKNFGFATFRGRGRAITKQRMMEEG